jgi:hypothetical protein
MIIQNMINELLQRLLLQIQSILSDQFVGMYIGGSIANNSFNDETALLHKTVQKNTIF